MQRFKTYISISAALLLTALASCNKADDIGGTLPDGTTPINFTATMDNLDVTTGEVDTRATTRATAPEGLALAISSDLGTTKKTYTVAEGGTNLTATDPIYWTKQSETLAAWTPATIVSGTPANAGEYNIATQTTGTGGSFENVFHAPVKAYTFSKTNSVELKLIHAFAKVNITLIAGDGIKSEDLAAATVTLSGYTSGTMGYTGLVGSGANDGIQPTKNIATHTAYLIPQQMQGKRFIRVTSNGNDYYYTPATATDANLTAGKQYTYNVTVNKDGLTVILTENGDWTSGGNENVTSVTTFGANDLKIGDYYYSDGTTSDGGYRKYADGSTATLPINPVLEGASGTPRTVLGIVMKVGKDDTGDWKDDCTYKLKDGTTNMPTIHGYVLALKDANDGNTCQWEPNGVQIGTSQSSAVGFYGYGQTQAIKTFVTTTNSTLEAVSPATYHATDGYETTYLAPASSSGWFLPSAGQCQYWLNNKDLLLIQVKKATGATNYNWQSYYWSSSELDDRPSSSAWCLVFSYGSMLNGNKYSDAYRVRSCLAF